MKLTAKEFNHLREFVIPRNLPAKELVRLLIQNILCGLKLETSASKAKVAIFGMT